MQKKLKKFSIYLGIGEDEIQIFKNQITPYFFIILYYDNVRKRIRKHYLKITKIPLFKEPFTLISKNN